MTTLMEVMARYPEAKWEMYSPFRQGPQGVFSNNALIDEFAEACDEGIQAFAPDNPVRWEDDGSVHLIRADGEEALLLRLVDPGRIRISTELREKYIALINRAAKGEGVDDELKQLEARIVEENLRCRD